MRKAPFRPVDSFPSLSSDYKIDENMLAEYRTKGAMILRGVFEEDEISSYSSFVKWNLYASADESSPSHSESYSENTTSNESTKPFLRVHNLWKISDHVRRLSLSPRLSRLAAKLLGCEKVRIYQDSAFFKEPGDRSSPWHQDQLASPLEWKAKFLTFWIPLEKVTASQGTLMFAEASHLTDYKKIGHRGIPVREIGQYRGVDEDNVKKTFRIMQAASLDVGDITVHDGWTLHCSPPNKEGRTRMAFAVSYFADGEKVNQEGRAGICDDISEWSRWVSEVL